MWSQSGEDWVTPELKYDHYHAVCVCECVCIIYFIQCPHHPCLVLQGLAAPYSARLCGLGQI